MGKAVLGITKVAFTEMWPPNRVAIIDRFHCTTPHLLCYGIVYYNRNVFFSPCSGW